MSKNKSVIEEDLEQWFKRHNLAGGYTSSLLYFLTYSRDFRSIFYFRTRNYIITRFLRLYCPKEKYFIIDPRTKIAGGITSGHPYATILNAESIGKNFFVNQLVTVGEIDGKRPVIGDNVSIFSGAIVIGGIHIGDNSKIGAGAVVVKDVPEGSVVVGNPARIVNKTD